MTSHNETDNIDTHGELRQFQMVLLEMLLELDRICREHGIEYSLIGGTLLGRGAPRRIYSMG